MKIIVIGSVAAGTSVAAKARRNTEEAEIVVYDQGRTFPILSAGSPTKLAGSRFSGSPDTTRCEMVQKRYDVSIFTEHRVTKVDHEAKRFKLKI